jgi:hypothetical protein
MPGPDAWAWDHHDACFVTVVMVTFMHLSNMVHDQRWIDWAQQVAVLYDYLPLVDTASPGRGWLQLTAAGMCGQPYVINI